MNELEEIKARAKERRANHPSQMAGKSVDVSFQPYREAELDLERAIAIAEEHVSYYADLLASKAILREERDQARADVLKLRRSLIVNGHSKESAPVLADTEHYELYR